MQKPQVKPLSDYGLQIYDKPITEDMLNLARVLAGLQCGTTQPLPDTSNKGVNDDSRYSK